MTAPDWVEDAEGLIAHVERVAPKQYEGPPTYLVHTDERYVLAEKLLRWAVWCVESLYQLRDFIDKDDPRGDNRTPLGHRADATAFGHIMWAAVTAMGALDRVAAAFGALHLGLQANGHLYDFNKLWDKRKGVRSELVRQWLRDVHHDPAYKDLLKVLRNPLTHGTTRRSLYVSARRMPYEQRPPHHEATEFIVGETSRSVSAVQFLTEIIPSVENHVRAAVNLIQLDDAFPQEPSALAPH